MRIREWLLVSFILVLFTSAAGAQCPLPDNFDPPAGACCQQTTPVLPTFPGFAHDILSICWRGCNLDAQVLRRAIWTAPVPASTPIIPPICSVYVSKLRIEDAGGVLHFAGNIRMWYSRTWMEADPSGAPLQVWRFLLNGDLKPQPAAGLPPCPVPPCAAAFNNRARYTGYLDYALNCSTGTFQFAWMLDHECDRIDHAPGFARAGVFHGDRSYNFVGPAAGFVPMNTLPFESGPGGLEAVRRLDLPVAGSTAVCYFEEPTTPNTTITPLQQLCVCGPASGPAQYAFAKLTVAGVCGTGATSTVQFPKGFISKSIGMWTVPAAYPGLEILRWNIGGYNFADVCNGVVRGEVFYGVTTMRGFPAFKLPMFGGTPLPLTFIDQGNSLRFPGNTTTMNIEYASNHILNLNFP